MTSGSYGNIKTRHWLRHSPVPSLSCRTEVLPIAVKHYAKGDIKVFWNCLILVLLFFCQKKKKKKKLPGLP